MKPVADIGYITRYAPGLRRKRNGGVYTHAATWAIAAAGQKCATAIRLVSCWMQSTRRTKTRKRYWAEPYVTPGKR